MSVWPKGNDAYKTKINVHIFWHQPLTYMLIDHLTNCSSCYEEYNDHEIEYETVDKTIETRNSFMQKS